jgi:hypothetical protein
MFVAISRKNVDKAAFGFLALADDLDAMIPVRYLQKLASYGCRYSGICQDMLPYVRALYDEYRGMCINASKTVSVNYRRVVRVFRILILLTSLDESRFARTIASFSPAAARYIIEFDASLWGVGLLWYRIDHDVDDNGNDVIREFLIGGAAVDISYLQLDQKSSKHQKYQNTAEFIAQVLGVRGLQRLGLLYDQACTVHLRGDSKTALKWASSGRFRSNLVYNASSVHILQNQLLRVTMAEQETRFIIGKTQNRACDFLSRNFRSGVARLARFMNDDKFLNLKEVDLDEGPLLTLCDPYLVADTDEEFIGFWGRIRKAVLG